jgi:hypothetical protein
VAAITTSRSAINLRPRETGQTVGVTFRIRARVPANDQQANHNRAHQHCDPYIESSMKGLVAGGGAQTVQNPK